MGDLFVPAQISDELHLIAASIDLNEVSIRRLESWTIMLAFFGISWHREFSES
ncbi:hypothetical protein [Bradyrhizobium huanghuaihaiense]